MLSLSQDRLFLNGYVRVRNDISFLEFGVQSYNISGKKIAFALPFL